MRRTAYRRSVIFLALLLFAAFLPGLASATDASSVVEQWGVFEITLPGPASGNPYLETELSAIFSQKDRTLTVPGFYDGKGRYRIRFSPPAQGQWRYATRSNCPELNGESGSFTVGSPSDGNHGPMEVFKTFYLRHADGTAYHQFGTTCYAWVHQTDGLQQQTLKTLAGSPFNKIRFCVFPKNYTYSKNEPKLFAFVKKADGTFDFDRPDPKFWHHFEGRILALQKLGIEADLILWHPYDRWGFADMSDTEDDRYLRYCIARLSCYRNVWWSLANEFDFMTDRPKGHRGNKQMDDWDRFFEILKNEDPHGRMRGIHNGRIWYDHTRDWVTHASLQTSNMAGGVGYREKYQKPVLVDECKYEGDVPQGWGNLTAREMTQRFWLGTLSGCYVGHGETYMHPKDILWWSKGGELHGQSPQRIQWLKELMAQAPPFDELKPLGSDQGTYLLAKPGEYYLLYCLDSRPQSLQLAGNQPYKVDTVDPWEMTVLPQGTAEPGEHTVQSPKSDLAFRFTPYKPGEKLRPVAKISASVTEGIPPLTVTFRSETNDAAKWEFGDGTTSTKNPVTHTFADPGVHNVLLRVTDQGGGSAVDQLQILVDRDSNAPIVRAGFENNEIPALSFEGTAKRGKDATILLPDGKPWGWVTAGVVEDLRGLRSFTVMGWTKPESMQVGMGGNRIVFCLDRDHSGIDLVCHSDGRLRLSVNQWPDRVKNDSSPGKLVVGKWTRFAVTYDATKAADNVHWYFSKPQEALGGVPITLDRNTTHNVGPIAVDIGPLAIGNFNRTMKGYGMDRQFRGELRGIQIFGSLVSGRGALSLDEIRKQ